MFFGMDIEAVLNKITELNHEAFAQGLRESTQATYDSGACAATSTSVGNTTLGRTPCARRR